jgi:DNA-binding beta-propeller fold protein YncE
VLDELRNRLYLVNNSTSQVIIFDYASSTVVGNFGVGKSPVAGAISMDGRWLYVPAEQHPRRRPAGRRC